MSCTRNPLGPGGVDTAEGLLVTSMARLLEKLRRLVGAPPAPPPPPPPREADVEPADIAHSVDTIAQIDDTAQIAVTEAADEEEPPVAPESAIIAAEQPTAAPEPPSPVEAKPLAQPAPPVKGALLLRLESERGEPTIFEITRSGATLGRGEENAVRLVDLSVSRRHARIAHRQGGYWLSDLGSMGGTWVDGARLNAARRLTEGQTIDIGVCRLTVISIGESSRSTTDA